MSGNLKKTKEDRFSRHKRKRSRLRKGSRKVIEPSKPKTTQEEKVKRQQILRSKKNEKKV